MNNNEIRHQIQSLIAQGNLEDAVQTLIAFFDNHQGSQYARLKTQALHHLSQLNELNQQVQLGIIEHSHADIKRNQIRTALLHIVQEIHEPDKLQSKTEATSPFPKSQNRRRIWVLAGMALMVSLAVVLFLFSQKRQNNKSQKVQENSNDTIIQDPIQNPSDASEGTLPIEKAIESGENIRSTPHVESPPNPEKTDLKVNYPSMKRVEGGTYIMGGGYSAPDTIAVTVSTFYLSETEITVAQYKTFCDDQNLNLPTEPHWGWKDHYPITHLQYNEMDAYCKWLGKKQGKKYRLPTEAEWEFAARGGKNGAPLGYKYSGGNNIDEVACWNQKEPCPVKSKKRNNLGLYDMTGNVDEACIDWADKEGYFKNFKNSTNPVVRSPVNGFTYRATRGGNYTIDNKDVLELTIRGRLPLPEENGKKFFHFGFRVLIEN